MYRRTIRLNERADVHEEARKLKDAAGSAGVSEREVEQLGFAFESAIAPLVDSGRKMKQQGSQMNVRRTLEGENYEIEIHFGNVRRRGFIAWLFGLLRSD